MRPFPGPDMKQQVLSEGGVQPQWARNGEQLFYPWQDQVVDVWTDGGFATRTPRLLFERPGCALGQSIRCHGLSLEGKRFLMVKLDQMKPTPVTEMILVLNWFQELTRLIPTK